MSYIPPDAKWWLADLVVEFRIDGDPGSLVHFNLTLIRADSAEQAYSKALARGAEFADTYTNTDGRQVQVFFRGAFVFGCSTLCYEFLNVKMGI